MRFKSLGSAAAFENFTDGCQAQAHALQRDNGADRGQLGGSVVTVAGKGVNLFRKQETHLLKIAQHSDTDVAKLGKFSDFQHIPISFQSRFS